MPLENALTNLNLFREERSLITKNRNVLRKIEIFKYTVLYNNNMLEEVLDSEAKIRIMKLLSRFPERQFQAVGVARLAKLSVSRTSECLNDLADKGILQARKIGKGFLFEVNKSNYLTRTILEFFEKERNLVEVIAKDFAPRVKRLDKIKCIVLFGSAVKEVKIGSDIDFLIVSEDEINKTILSKITADLTAKYGFPVSAIAMTTSELKRKAGEEFIINVRASGRIIFGKDLEEIIYGKGS